MNPIAFDENSIRAIAVGSEFALCNDGVILLMHVVPLNRLHGGIPSTAVTQREEIAASNAKLTEIANRYTGGARNEVSIRLGDPTEEIIKAAIDFNADVIVMATHGRKGLSHLLIGSVTEGVLRKAVCPVSEASELMAAVQTAMVGRLPFTVLRDALFAHPTISEGLVFLLAQVESREAS